MVEKEEVEEVDIGSPAGREQQLAAQLGVAAGRYLPLLHLPLDLDRQLPAILPHPPGSAAAAAAAAAAAGTGAAAPIPGGKAK